VTEGFESVDQAAGFAFGVAAAFVEIDTEILELLAGGEQMPDHVDEAVCDRDGCLVWLGLSTCFGPSLAFCFGPSCGWGEWRSVGLGWGAVGGGFPAVVLPGAGAGDAEEIADFGPGAFLVASVGDRGGE
jgi:hypothetical protein